MSTFNRVLNVLIFILALVAVIVGYFLFERRKELRQRGDILAKYVAKVAEVLDEKSGTDVKEKLNVTKSIPHPTNPDKTYEGGTLGWAQFHFSKDAATGDFNKFDEEVALITRQAEKVRQQRDFMGTAFQEQAEIMEMETPEDAASYQKVEGYAERIKKITDWYDVYHKRSEEYVAALVQASEKIEEPFTKEAAKNIDPNEGYGKVLGQFGENLTRLKNRTDKYATSIVDLVKTVDHHNFSGVNVQDVLSKDNYLATLTALKREFQEINDDLKDYDKVKVELRATKLSLDKTIEALETAHENISSLEAQIVNIEADLATTEQRLKDCRGTIIDGPDEGLKQKLQGEVMEVNYDYNYIIINLGANQKIPPNVTLTIARDEEFICKVNVSKVFDNYSVAEILPERKQGEVLEGDRVIF